MFAGSPPTGEWRFGTAVVGRAGGDTLQADWIKSQNDGEVLPSSYIAASSSIGSSSALGKTRNNISFKSAS